MNASLLSARPALSASLTVILLLAACSDDVSKTTPDQGSEPPIRTVDQGRPTPDMPRDMAAVDAPADLAQQPDSASLPDMSIPAPDQGCAAGEVLGCVDDQSALACNTAGTAFEPVACAAGEQCIIGIGCTTQVCLPRTQACEGAEQVKLCNAEGSGYEAPTACPEGTLCSRGACVSQCELGKYRSSYVGCEYWTLDLDQYTDPSTNPKPDAVPHAVVISNPGTIPATVTFRAQAPGISVNVPDPVVPPGSSRAFTMPRLDISGTGITSNSIQVSSSVPVTAHQFNPLNNERVYSNDASLLLPSNTLGDEYYVVNWPTQVLPCIAGFCPESQHSYVTILATEPGKTFLNVKPTAQIMADPNGMYKVSPGVTRSFELNYGEVLNLQASSGNLMGANDLTGTYIKATQPIAVFAGHEEAVIGQPGQDDSCCADHLEQQLFPLKDWGMHYVAALSPGRGTKVDHWRIVAGQDGVTLTTTPPQPGANNVTLNRGQFVSFFSDQSFEVNATGKILVGQFLVSQEQTSAGTGDPAFILTVPIERFRSDYILLTPQGYTSDYVLITRQAGEIVRLNNTIIPETSFRPVGSGAYEVAELAVQPGVQVLEGNKPFGISAYGFNSAVSYGYPGGLDLVGSEVMNP